MASQQQMFTDGNATPRPNLHQQGSDDVPAPIWLQRMSLVVLVLFCLYIGGLLAILPWSPRYWDHNAWIVAHPALKSVLDRGWVRGLVSGLGLIDIWIGVSELLHYHDARN